MTELPFMDVRRAVWLAVVAFGAIAVVYGFARKSAALRAFAEAHLLGVLAPDVSRGRQVFKAVLVLAAMTCVVLAAMGPRWGTYFEDAQQPQLDVMVCLDVSRSMLAEDAGMSRLERAKDDIRRLVKKLSGHMVGLVCFAGKSELTCPLTDDYEFYRLSLDDVGVHSAPVGGTDIGDAIKTASSAFSRTGKHHRVVFVLTDGEDHGGHAAEAARLAHADGVDIYTIGIGDPDRGGLIPIERDGHRTYLVHDGQQLWSKLDEDDLRRIAMAGGGAYERSRLVAGTERTLEWLYANRVAPTQMVTREARKIAKQYPRYHWAAAAALVLLTIESLIGERRAAGVRAASLNGGRG